MVDNVIKADQPCNLVKVSDLNSGDFDYSAFVELYAHEDCTALAFYLHDRFGLKIGAVRANDLNNPDDCGYETIVHQFVYLPSGFVLDARGVDTELAMLNYYQESAESNNEDWDFIIEEDFCHELGVVREHSEHEDSFNQFLNLLSSNLNK